MNEKAALAWLYGLQFFGIKLGLQNIRELLSRLGDPHHGLPCIHVAGTNGKGSVSLFLSEICRHAGYRVGLYTSPHLHCFTERIRINGEQLAATELPALVEEVRAAAAGIPVTFFEATTALALLAMRRAGVEVAVVETGMGGRLDATNVVEPLLCCITPVSLDHQEHLGETLAAIATEKAGIIKPGVPVNIALQSPEADEVLTAAARSCQAEFRKAGHDYRWGGSHAAMWFRSGELALDGLRCALPGDHQLGNFAQAIAAAGQLRRRGLTLADAAICRAGITARWPGRLEWFGNPPSVLLDGAHNRLGAISLAAYLNAVVDRPVRLLAGLSGQRDPDQVLAPLLPLARALYVTPVPEVASVPVAALRAWGDDHGVPVQPFDSPAAALRAVLQAREEGEIVVVAGSLYLVAAVRALLLESDTRPSPLTMAEPELL